MRVEQNAQGQAIDAINIPIGSPFVPGAANAVGVLVTDGTPGARWRIDLYAATGERGSYYVGSLLTAASPERIRSRCVGFACCPGAVNWSARVYPGPDTPAGALADIDIVLGPASGSFGVTPNGPYSTATYL